MKKTHHTVGIIPISNIKIVERNKTDIPNTKIHDHTMTCFGTGTPTKSGGVKLVSWDKPPLLVK